MPTTLRSPQGSVAELHALEIPPNVGAELWHLEIREPTLVLGSAQREAPELRAAATARGLDVVRRASGGGAVLLDAAEVVWIDVVIGRDHSEWTDDVGRAFLWVGEAWQRALAALRIDTSLHGGGLIDSGWGRQVCFAGVGTGELLVDGAKLLGLSQRRTRAGARFQCALLRRWAPERFVDLVEVPGREVATVAVGLESLVPDQPSDAAIVAAVLAELG